MLLLLYPNVTLEIVENGVEALEMLKIATFDLILSDVDMPKMNGYDLLSEVKNTMKLSIPIISITAFAISGDREKLLLHGFDDYISKPIDMNDMKRTLDKYIKQGA
jgi:CheY-like chemotaxis protein